MLPTNLTKMPLNKEVIDLNELMHFGILGMRWGVRRTPEQLGHLSKEDAKWVKKNSNKITKNAQRNSFQELSKYADELMKNPDAINKTGKLSASTVNAYNRKMASLMNEQVTDIRSPSGKVVKYVAKRGEIGVHMALADEGYNIDQLKNGIWNSGRIAYKKETVDMEREDDY